MNGSGAEGRSEEGLFFVFSPSITTLPKPPAIGFHSQSSQTAALRNLPRLRNFSPSLLPNLSALDALMTSHLPLVPTLLTPHHSPTSEPGSADSGASGGIPLDKAFVARAGDRAGPLSRFGGERANFGLAQEGAAQGRRVCSRVVGWTGKGGGTQGEVRMGHSGEPHCPFFCGQQRDQRGPVQLCFPFPSRPCLISAAPLSDQRRTPLALSPSRAPRLASLSLRLLSQPLSARERAFGALPFWERPLLWPRLEFLAIRPTK